jgi:hypothetical protein
VAAEHSIVGYGNATLTTDEAATVDAWRHRHEGVVAALAAAEEQAPDARLRAARTHMTAEVAALEAAISARRKCRATTTADTPVVLPSGGAASGGRKIASQPPRAVGLAAAMFGPNTARPRNGMAPSDDSVIDAILPAATGVDAAAAAEDLGVTLVHGGVGDDSMNNVSRVTLDSNDASVMCGVLHLASPPRGGVCDTVATVGEAAAAEAVDALLADVLRSTDAFTRRSTGIHLHVE